MATEAELALPPCRSLDPDTTCTRADNTVINGCKPPRPHLQIKCQASTCMLLQDGMLRPMALCLGNAENSGGSLGPPLGGDVFTCLAFPQGPSAGLQGQNHLYVGAASGAVYQVSSALCAFDIVKCSFGWG